MTALSSQDAAVSDKSPPDPAGTPTGTEPVTPGVVREVRVMADGRRVTYYRREHR